MLIQGKIKKTDDAKLFTNLPLNEMFSKHILS